ncbi:MULTISPECIES: carboxylesterase/lipase family protein [unclassified Microbacterium]|uniref:carboxylesterase/lipase family protein n=1 Tax=unclassified Microbacterium TaxID=2609290 RepID=UPI001E5BC45C|nr:carboxylesterase family protein [Microbacterium sp. MAH-37]
MDDRRRVTISSGTVEGVATDGISRFLGIPYAAAPFGPNRFREPQPAPPWDGVRAATAFGPTAPQLPYGGAIGELLGHVIIDGEDILTANVWAPEDASGAPVVLWIHGGALERGAAALPGYDGSAFARDGIVFVSVNYRLGAEGFSVLEGAPRNLGLRDAAAALRWTHDEIEAFGGDPERITVMGESAGGALVAALLSRDDTRALISRAIIQSGPLDAQTPERGGRVTTQMAKLLGTTADRDAFAAVTPAALLDARSRQAAGSSPLGGAPGYQLVIDPESLPRSPHEVLGGVDTPLIIGTNTDEYRLWFTPQALDRIGALKLLVARLALKIPGRAVRAFRADDPDASTGELFGRIATDLLLRGPASRVARARTAPTHLYEFAWHSPVRELRAAHAVELPFMFGTADDPSWSSLIGEHPPASLAAEMHDAWAAFIRDGDPGWPAYGSERLTRLFDTETETVPQRRARGMDLLP